MSEYAPSFPLFIGSVIFLIYCIYSITINKSAVKNYSSLGKLLFYTLFGISSVVFIWGFYFVLEYFLT